MFPLTLALSLREREPGVAKLVSRSAKKVKTSEVLTYNVLKKYGRLKPSTTLKNLRRAKCLPYGS
jgi:hypothetical protein